MCGFKILELLEFDSKTIIEVESLIDLSNKLEIIDKVRDYIFEFHPKYDDNGRCETFAHYYKVALLSEISYEIALNIKNDDEEDFALFCQQIWLDNPTNNVFFNTLLNYDLNDKNKEEIIVFFKNKLNFIINNYNFEIK